MASQVLSWSRRRRRGARYSVQTGVVSRGVIGGVNGDARAIINPEDDAKRSAKEDEATERDENDDDDDDDDDGSDEEARIPVMNLAFNEYLSP